MSAFSSWILSIVGCLCLTTLIDLLLPEGETKKYVKCISSLIVFSVMLSPLTAFIGGESSLQVNSSYEEETSTKIDENYDFLYKIKEKECANQKERAIAFLESKGIKGVDIEVILSYGKRAEILEIIADKQNAVITNEKANIDIVKEIKSCMVSYFNVDEGIVEVIN